MSVLQKPYAVLQNPEAKIKDIDGNGYLEFRLWTQETWIWQKIMEVSFLLAGNGHLMLIQATFIQLITCDFTLTESSINHLLSTFLETVNVHISGELLVLYSASSTVCSRPKITRCYDDQRKSPELSTKNMRVN